MSPLAHRADIQGLRAVCILSVVLYHAQLPGFSGGFVGVDVFFVVSGFLIVGMLLDEISHTGRIDLVGFWGRRARRLLPNATLALTVILAVGAAQLPPHAWDTLGRDVAAAAVYCANYYFASKTVDYFHFGDQLSPVLHFWSLSIEEQFYVLWPVLLLAAWWHPRYRKVAPAALLGLVWAFSFAYCMVAVSDNQPLAFFHTETRCWQLATGGLAAVYIRRYAPLSSRLIGWLSLGTIVAAVASLSDQMSYPSLLALLPTIGAAGVLLTYSTHRYGVAILLGQRPLQWIGARSYSWYLWHWPALVYAGMLWPGQRLGVLLAVAASLAFAHFIFKHLEDPIRRGVLWLPSPRWSLVASAAAIIAVVTCSAAVARIPGMMGGSSAEMTAALKISSTDRGQNYADACHLGYEAAPHRDCAYGDAAAPRSVVLFGDSHAAQWFPAINETAISAGWKFHAWTKTSCPSIDVTIWYAPRRTAYWECDQWRRETIARIVNQRPDLVLISNHTDYGGWVQDRTTGEVLKREAARRAWQQGLRSTLEILTQAGVPVVLIRDTPKAFKSFATCLAKGGGSACDRPRSHAVEAESVDVAIAREFAARGVAVLDLTDRLCGRLVCPTMQANVVIYADYHHITATFSKALAPEFGLLLPPRSH